MIYDSLHAISEYRGMYRSLDALIDWLDGHDPADLPLGTTEIDGRRVYANVMEATTRAAEDAHYEYHRLYMDVQMDLEGSECFKTARGALVEVGAFDDGGDFGLCDAGLDADVLDGALGRGRFVLFAVNEPHMPTLEVPGEGPRGVRKICFKLVSDEHWDTV